MNGFDFVGKHVCFDATNIETTNYSIYSAMEEAVKYSKATVIKKTIVAFNRKDKLKLLFFPWIKKFRSSNSMGLSIIFTLSESHFTAHTYPETNSCFFDLFTCGDTCLPDVAMDKLKNLLDCKGKIYILNRG